MFTFDNYNFLTYLSLSCYTKRQLQRSRVALSSLTHSDMYNTNILYTQLFHLVYLNQYFLKVFLLQFWKGTNYYMFKRINFGCIWRRRDFYEFIIYQTWKGYCIVGSDQMQVETWVREGRIIRAVKFNSKFDLHFPRYIWRGWCLYYY
jgi:hypothetical protein